MTKTNQSPPEVEVLSQQVKTLTSLVKSLAEAVSLNAAEIEALRNQVAGAPKSEQLEAPPAVIVVKAGAAVEPQAKVEKVPADMIPPVPDDLPF